ncbi:MAG: hypothetical protein RR872_01540 [Mucinivorans sp.]
MKKILLSLLALVAMTVVACGPNKAVEAQKTLLTESIAKVDSIQSLDELVAFQMNFAAQDSINAVALADLDAASEDATVLADLNAQWVAKMQSKSDELVALKAAADTADSIAAREARAALVVKK